MGTQGFPAVPVSEIMRRRWETGPNSTHIRHWARRMEQLTPARAELLGVAVALEEGDLPLVEQIGFAQFRPADHDRRLISPDSREDHEQSSQAGTRPPTARTTALDPRAASGGPEAGAEAAEAGAPARELVPRQYGSVGEVIEEDSRGLALYFPQFQPPVYDRRLRLWFREGWLHPLRWWPARFGVRLYYDVAPEALPLVRVGGLHPQAPHTWQQMRNDVSFRSLCYTFAPDGTIVRGRDFDDDASEVLRQSVTWLLRYLVWLELGFWPGEEVGHDPAIIERLTRPGDPCPAHSWRKYGECCRPRILAKIRRRVQLRDGINPGMRVA